MEKPFISVVVASYNRQETLPKVIEDLLAQELKQPLGFEIVFVDNNSTDRTKEIIESYILRSAGKLRYIKQVLAGKSNALNMGINESKGEIIAFTDDDVHVDRSWLSSLINCFEKNRCDGVGGRVLPIYPPKTPLWARNNPDQMAGAVVIYDQGDKTKKAGKGLSRFIGANWAFKKSVFIDIGYFRTDLGPGTPAKMGEDEEFYQRLIKNGKVLYYCAEALILHPLDLNRLKLKNTAQWHISLGRFEAKKEYEEENLNLIFWAGIPRYIIKGIISDLLLMPLNIFNVLKFRYYFRSFFRKLGMIYEYQDIKRRSL